MKDSFESAALGRTEADGFSNRKLIRPSLSRSEHSVERRERPANGERANAMERSAAVDRSNNGKKTPPPEQTHAENFYYQKQMQAKTPMVVVLKDGETMQGIIEWYDRNCIKINRSGGQPNVLIYKPSIKYMFKQSEENHKG